MTKTLTIRNQGVAGQDFSTLRVRDPSSSPAPALTVDVIACDCAPSRGVVLLADSVRALRDHLDVWLDQNVPPAPDPVVSGSLV